MFGTRKSEESTAEDQVRLKPLGGIRPGIYLAALYSLILLGVLFVLLAYQGLTNPGSLAVISSEPSGAAVRVDGVTLGAAPCRIFIPRGKREIELVLPGFTPLRLERDIPGPLLGAPLFPHREYIDGTLRAEDPLEPLILAASEFAAWSFTGEPTAAFQVPPVLSEGAYRAGGGVLRTTALSATAQSAAAQSPSIHRELDRVLRGALRFTVTRAGLRDLLRAKFLIDNGGLSPSPVSLLRSLGEMAAFVAETPEASAWLAPLLPLSPPLPPPPEGGALRVDSSPPLSPPGSAAVDAAARGEISRRGFLELPAGVLIRETALPRQVALEGFWIAAAEVSAGDWAAFLEDSPRWRPENAPALRDEGLATSDYLAPQDNGGYPAPAQSGLSWYAATAYCEWLTGRLPPSLAAYEVRLPTEAEWEYAAKQAGGPADMTGGLWEWCAEPFAPLPFFPADEELSRRISSPERPVKGGSWVSAPLSVGIETRASLPPSSCSAFVGFRPVIARRGAP
jgi:hypothetical protein